MRRCPGASLEKPPWSEVSGSREWGLEGTEGWPAGLREDPDKVREEKELASMRSSKRVRFTCRRSGKTERH